MKKYIKYILWRRAYWDCIIQYGEDCAATRLFRMWVYKSATKKQYDFAIQYGETLL